MRQNFSHGNPYYPSFLAHPPARSATMHHSFPRTVTLLHLCGRPPTETPTRGVACPIKSTAMPTMIYGIEHSTPHSRPPMHHPSQTTDADGLPILSLSLCCTPETSGRKKGNAIVGAVEVGHGGLEDCGGSTRSGGLMWFLGS